METRPATLDALVATGKITEEQARWVMERARVTGIRALRVLTEERIVTEEDVYRLVAKSAGMTFVDASTLSPHADALARIPAEWAHKLQALPFAWDGTTLSVAVANPNDQRAVEDLPQLTNAPTVTLVLAAPTALQQKISEIFRADSELSNLADQITTETVDETEDFTLLGSDEDEAPVVRWVNVLIAQAIADRASDIHIEPTETDLQVRFRIDGVLHLRQTVTKANAARITSRIKVMSELDISEKRKPVDGRMAVNLSNGGRRIDVRVAILPTINGEKVVLRLLDSNSTTTLSDLGLSPHNEVVFKRHYRKPHGMILACGPTGSGKSTTLYAALDTIKNESINVVTVEDPVEYRMKGVTQMQINNQAGMTFSSALRSVLRSDPDVILVGEIRDTETAKIGVEAALTGHLVLSTLHTNDAASAVTRLTEMGIEPYLVGSALSLIVAQRLLRRLCDKCAQTYTPDPQQLKDAGYPWEEGTDLPVLKRAVGCKECSKTGYRGRTAIHELLEVDATVEAMVSHGAHSDEIREHAAKSQGMRLMREDGWEKVAAGITTIEEVLRVTA